MVVGRRGRMGEDLFREKGIKTFSDDARSLDQTLSAVARDAALVICESLFAESVFARIARALPLARKILHVHEEVDNDLLEQGLWQYGLQRDVATILAEFDLVIFPSEHTKAFYTPLKRNTNEFQDWLVIPNTANEQLTSYRGRMPQKFRVLQLGTVSKRKNPLLTLIAFEMFLHSHKAPDAELLFVGYRNANDREREYVRALRTEIRARKLMAYVTIKPTHLFTGKDLFEASAVTLHSSSECSPTVFLEAALFGKMAIGPDIGGIAEIITENLNGHLFRYGDCATQAKLIGQLYEDRESLPQRMPRIKEQYFDRFSNSLFFARLDAASLEAGLAKH